MIALEVVFVAVYVAVAATIFWRRSEERLALLGAITLLTEGVGGSGTLGMLAEVHPLWWLPAMSFRYIGSVALAAFFNLFPQGRFVPRWTGWLVMMWAVLEIPDVFFYESAFNFQQWHPLFSLAVWFVVLGGSLVAGIYRYRRVLNVTQRQQTKWAIFGMVVGAIGFLCMVVLVTLFPWMDRPGSPAAFAVGAAFYGFKLLYPLGIGIAVLRYRLWDIDPIINRTLLYGALTLSVIGIYVLVVGYLGALFRTSGNLAISLVATGIVAVAFQPLRDYLQRGVSRLMYGDRDEPYAVISRLGHRLEASLAPDAVLPTIIATVKDALKLPYAAITLKDGDAFTLAAAVGKPPETPLSLPLVYQNEQVGQLVLGPRAPDEAWSPADRRLLDDLARQAGVAASAVQLTTALQQARQHLVMAREEERRRLRRDLHDGLGPALAAQTLKVGSARYLLAYDPQTADRFLAELETDIDRALQDVRRLVYDLRPPALDELGLVGAIQASAAQYTSHPDTNGNHTGVAIVVDVPEPLPPLPAAVEVAAYRIVQEALANVVRHARAQHCIVRLTLVGTAQRSLLTVEITDDGVGLPATRRVGVGLQSMRERAEELGGMCVIEAAGTGGTRVRAQLPLA